MAVTLVEIIVDGVPQSVVFDTGLQAFVATVPKRDDDLYDVVIRATDDLANITTVATFMSLPEGEIPRFLVKDGNDLAVAGVKITAYHRNPTGGANWGRADYRETGFDGIAFLYLPAGDYNIEIEKDGFVKQVVLNFQVFGGIIIFDNLGGTLSESHVVKDSAGAPLADASVKIVQEGATPQTALVYHQKTGAAGEWSVLLKPNLVYSITFEKPAFDLTRARVQSA